MKSNRPVNLSLSTVLLVNLKSPVAIASSSEAQFNPRYVFETFVVGSSNQFAHAAARAVAESPSHSYNPLFLYGGAGLGKTHLLHAIGHHVQRRHPSLRVVYLAAEQFVNELISSLRFGRMTAFRERYRTIDVLLVDDIQFIDEKKERTSEEFFHTFNSLYQNQKQIILSSDSPPRNLAIEERLRSRFEWGLIADLQPPDLETKVAILRRKADAERVRVHYVGWDAKYDEWVPPARVKPFAWPAARPKGQKVQVEWNGRWYPAVVLAERLGLHQVHYDDHSDAWDEWVAADRIRDADAKKERRRRRR